MTGAPQPAPSPPLSAPEPLRDVHDRSAFDCGAADLDDWLRSRAQRAEGLSARTFVICEAGAVIGYYCLAAGALARSALPSSRLRQNQPDPVPVVILGRLAVDRRHQRRRLGAWLLRDAILRAVNFSRGAGARGILVHALDDGAAAFYRKFDFLACPIDPHTLILPIETALAVFAVENRP